MARPTRQGVDYFPLDVYLDDKFKFIEIKYKLEGFAILIKLLQKIYSYGYWCKWTEDEILIFADENRTDLELIENVVAEAIKRDIFDKDLYDEYNILTSKGVQKRYKEIVRRRKDVEITTEYLLIANDFGVNADIMPTSSKHDVNKSTQSKVDKSKVDKSKTKKETIYSVLETYSLDEDLRQALKDFIEMRIKIKKPMTERAFKMVLKELDKLGETNNIKIQILEQSILHNWQTVYELNKNQPTKQQQLKPNKFHNFIQSDDVVDLEAVAEQRRNKLKEKFKG